MRHLILTGAAAATLAAATPASAQTPPAPPLVQQLNNGNWLPQAPQLLPSINGFNKVTANADGSVDLYFGPAKPTNVAQSNWIQTVNGRNFLVALRLYGTGVAFYDQSWKPDDVVKVR
jgi:hypothetical protein